MKAIVTIKLWCRVFLNKSYASANFVINFLLQITF